MDLSADGKLPKQRSSSTSSSDTSLSGDEDDPDDDSDEFIEFFSKSYQKRAKLKARAGGS